MSSVVHAEGEVGDVIIGGIAPPPGDTLWEQRDFIARDGVLRDFVLNEPRGGVFRHVNLLVPPKNSEAQMGFIIMEPEDTPPMSGSNSICVSTVLLDTGILPMTEPMTELVLEAPGGLVRVDGPLSRRQGREHFGAQPPLLRRPAGRVPRGRRVGDTSGRYGVRRRQFRPSSMQQSWASNWSRRKRARSPPPACALPMPPTGNSAFGIRS